MKSRTDRLVEIAERALDTLKEALAETMKLRDQARVAVEQSHALVVASRENRDREIARGVTQATFAELDAWMLVAKKRVVDAEAALIASEKKVAEARANVDEGLARVKQMEKLRERVQKEAHKKDAKKELRASDEALARKATSK